MAGAGTVEVVPEGGEDGTEEAEEAEEEAWEEELAERLRGKLEIRGWDVLRDDIKKDMSKHAKQYTIVQLNQLTIIRNFATLRLKGYKRIPASLEIARQWHESSTSEAYFARRVRALARHYQVFEQLPIEKRGGHENAQSHLNNEAVQTAAREWLTAQPTGQVTPCAFRAALNDTILAAQGIVLRKPLCERTARRWLVKLGWRRTVVRKGVYMDGHERPDVVNYRQKEFLPAMASYEARMDQYIGPELKLVPPRLNEGEKKVVALLRPGETVLRSKGRGRLIHVSDFITESTGRLVLLGDEGEVLEDARKIIFPGSNGDAWWDTAQLMVQVRAAIQIFEKAHPGCIALFIFDQSSAHASLPPDALRAFEMNKSNGGKQRRQRDTVIPMSNPDPAFRGKPQSMTTQAGEAKGLQQVLEERGFNVKKLRAKCSPVCPFESSGCCMARLLSQQDDFVNQKSMLELVIEEAGHACIFLPKFHCELNPIEMYWGWSKYRYREVPKKNFEHAKQVAVGILNSCPTDVIRRFINRSWRFMDAYRQGLTGKAAEWAVRKQKSHRQVSRTAMMHLDAVLNPAP
ncbi:hypothetical protein K466DRAFT_482133 [Polyporus arcularius HHB13444]|uniref:Tc1-like transposase DDE domain-containing protein n=1 Tax=Polyporus arcularius HHB13444 TaxID=1314778 RepID=A0A5C3PTM4_9APHY|nr:hypothetical protein K466DRAFT_482133 [Polyporus arcularius HHB13444]